MTMSYLTVRFRRVCAALFMLLFAFLVLPVQQAAGQDQPLDVFGYFQVYYANMFESQGAPDAMESTYENTFALQQANLFFNKNFNPKVNAFVNFEVTNAFSTEQNWGSFSLDEAWIGYKTNSSFELKAGLLTPTFNNLNEVKNRTPLLPYVIRPLAYEESFGDMLNLDAYAPDRAYVQVGGTLPVGGVKLEYAAYAGNSDIIRDHGGHEEEAGHVEEADHEEEAEHAEEAGHEEEAHEDIGHFGLHPGAGTDSSPLKTFGGRVGVRYKSLKAGISATRGFQDVEFARAPDHAGEHENEVPHHRIGGDLSFRVADFTLEAEAIKVLYSSDSPDVNLDKLFYYSLLNYDVTDRFFGFATYNYIEDQNLPVLDGGMKGYGVGAGFRPSFNVVVKTQYSHYTAEDSHGDFQFNSDYLHVGVSVLF